MSIQELLELDDATLAQIIKDHIKSYESTKDKGVFGQSSKLAQDGEIIVSLEIFLDI